MTDEIERRTKNIMATWIVPGMLIILTGIAWRTYDAVDEMRVNVAVVNARLGVIERRMDDQEARLRYVERIAPPKSQWP
jgi:hypothetical protein